VRTSASADPEEAPVGIVGRRIELEVAAIGLQRGHFAGVVELLGSSITPLGEPLQLEANLGGSIARAVVAVGAAIERRLLLLAHELVVRRQHDAHIALGRVRGGGRAA
jgi:hypothetical protein